MEPDESRDKSEASFDGVSDRSNEVVHETAGDFSTEDYDASITNSDAVEETY